MTKSFDKAVFIGFLLLVFWTMAFQANNRIKYFQTPTVPLEAARVVKHYIDFKDSIPNDTLYQIRSVEDFPIAYYRKIRTGLCFDNKCRLLDIILYWNITGRYLGFEMPKDEFLSKTDHEPFVPKEYERLNEILADPESPLGGFTYNQLILKPDTKEVGVDGISSATSPAVLDHVVEGAVYTTYQLWQYTYGPAQQEVENLTKNALSQALILKIMGSPDKSDRMWALNHIKGYVELNPMLRDSLLHYISSDNYSLAERAINAIHSDELRDDSLQLQLLYKFYKEDYSLQKLLIDKIKEAPELLPQVKTSLASGLHSFSGEIFVKVLDVLDHQGADGEIYHKIAALLEKDNYFISRKAYDFLIKNEVKDKKIEKMLHKYATKQGI